MCPDAKPAAPQPDAICDAIGLLCPLPVLRARKQLIALPPGALLEVLADDPMARIDLPHFCAEAGHALLTAEPAPQANLQPERPAWRFMIRRG